MRPVWRDTDSAGEIVVMPLTPVATFVTRKTWPLARFSR